MRSALPEKGWAAGRRPPGLCSRRGLVQRDAPPISLLSCQKRNGPCTVQREKRLARSGAVALRAHGGRRIGACSDFAWPSGTLWPSARSILPSRGGWCGGRRGARTHLSCFSFRAFRFATRCPGGRGGVRPYGDAKGHLSARRGRCPHRPAAADLTLCTRFMGRFRRTRADMKSTFPGRRNRYPAAFFR